MSFLGSLFLIALPLAAVPVLIHLYRGRQRDVIYWGATQFLEKALTKGRSWERLEELLLMALRTALVLALIFALARPMVSSAWWGGSGKKEVVLLLDNSLSLDREVEGVSAGQQLREQALQVLEELSGEHTVHVMLAAGGGEWLTPEGIQADQPGRDKLAAELAAVKPTQGTSTLLSSLMSIVQMAPIGEPHSRRVVVFTDNQTSAWQLDAGAAWEQLKAAIKAAEVPTSVQLVDCSVGGEGDNAALMNFECSQHVALPGETIDCRVEVRNTGQQPRDQDVLRWFVNENEVAVSDVVALSPGESLQASERIRLEEAGPTLISCRLDSDDELLLDQQAQMVVEVTEELPILVIADSPGARTKKSPAEFLSAALGYGEGKALEWHSIYKPTQVSPAELSETSLSNYRAVVVPDLQVWDEATSERLSSFVRSGGGLWLALGDQLDRTEFNRVLFDDGDGLAPLSLASLYESEALNAEASLIHPPEGTHPAIAQLGNITQLDIDEARVLVHWQFAAGLAEDRATNVLLETDSGDPLVVENFIGQGKIIVQSFPLGLQWTNLPRLKSYVVMVADWLDYLTASSSLRHNPAPGGPLVATLPNTADTDSVKLVLPDGESLDQVAREEDDAYLVRYWRTQLPGVYRVSYQDGDQVHSIPFQVERDPLESELVYLDDQQQTQIAEAGIGADETDPKLVEGDNETPTREPLWRMLVVGLIALLAMELLLSSLLTSSRNVPTLGQQLV